MLLQEPEATAWDLRWRMFGIPVRVHPFFWIMTAVLGWNWYNAGGFQLLLMWMGCVFVSILIHELGHVLMGMAFGRPGYIVLFAFGGLAIGSSDLRNPWKRILVTAAGPGAQLILLGLIFIPLRLLAQPIADAGGLSLPVSVMLIMLWFINLYWPILNLLPILPLDGGQIARDVCLLIFGRNGLVVALVLSATVSGLLALHCLLAEYRQPLIPYLAFGGIMPAIFFALFCISSLQALQIENERNRNRWEDSDRLPWER